ncbi:tripartite tricarboxylate transporter TctB family protein [Fredinandcohnia quinoae]|uniref:Tripartite tricarboxylate transporter TctB family protein n=1 Tax=Fredinandcohnia quinoae TaxID=2918902 RepID=A0AAW5EDI5_9BACI|nr:tripartite tricarboxylate transporter TctB family protein [Fredinandcohnia sp. SECRCQ15]MCH1626829.1 tripartite tricarboxylate transporter TctB family protein [Fredinandcohnia sp. SECRCQ15]
MLDSLNKKISIFLMVISIGYLVLSYRLPSYPYVPVDSDAVPITLGFILLILSILLFFQKDEKNEEENKLPKGEIKVLLTVLFLVLLFIILLEFLGFIISTALFLYFCSWFLGYKKWLSNVIVSLSIPLFIYFLFTSFLKIQLPQGILPF